MQDLTVRVGGVRLGLARYVGRQVALGIRPDDFEDASHVHDAPADTRLPVEVDLPRRSAGRRTSTSRSTRRRC